MTQRRLAGAGIVLAMIGACGARGPAEHLDPAMAADKLGERALAEHGRRQQAIHDEIARLGPHAWAGSYYEGDGLGENVSLELAPQGGATLMWTGCLGIYDQNWGTVSERDGMLQLALALPNERTENTWGFPEELLIVPWGERVYLIEPRKLERFARAVENGSEPRNGRWGPFLMRACDEAELPTGLPRIPVTIRKQ